VNHVPLISQTAPTWRDAIIQDAPPRPRNRVARRRLALASARHWIAVGAAAACLIFGYIGWRAWRDNPAVLAAPASAAPLREIALRTDGVLTRAWVEQTLKIDRRAGLMDLDLAALRDRLLQSGQVRTAVLARHFHRRQAPQFLINQGPQVVGGLRVAGAEGVEDVSDVFDAGQTDDFEIPNKCKNATHQRHAAPRDRSRTSRTSRQQLPSGWP
jgi:hypothetical protein